MQIEIETEIRSKYIALSRDCCPKCQGTALMSSRETCSCVWRSVFRIVLRKVHDIAIGAHLMRPICLIGATGPRGRSGDRYRLESFSSDVYLTAKRALTDPTEWALFRYHYLFGAEWKLCCKQIGLPYEENKHRKLFFDRCYSIEAALGRIFATLTPYALYPLDNYFSTARTADARAIPVPDALFPNGEPLRPPLSPRPAVAPAPDPFEAVKEGIRAAFRQGQTLTAICNDLNQRGVLPKRAPRWYPAMLCYITGPRPEASKPEPVPIEPAPAPTPAPPVPLAPFDIADAASTAHYARKGFRAGRSLNSLAAELTRLTRTEWRSCDVRHLLLNHPRETPRFKRAA